MMEKRPFDPVIETPRLSLVLMQDDPDQMLSYQALVCQNGSFLNAFPTMLSQMGSRMRLGMFWLSLIYANLTGTGANYLIYKKNDGNLIGQISLTKIDDKQASGELEIWISQRHTHNGFATEAQYALEQNFYARGLQKIIGLIRKDNTASLAMANKTGFRYVGKHSQIEHYVIFEKVKE